MWATYNTWGAYVINSEARYFDAVYGVLQGMGVSKVCPEIVR